LPGFSGGRGEGGQKWPPPYNVETASDTETKFHTIHSNFSLLENNPVKKILMSLWPQF